MRNIKPTDLSLDHVCFRRLNSLDFAQKLTLKTRIIHWTKGGAK
ncbi:hypothetical protein ACT4VJ_06400 [Acinetobacter baumannii]|nr:hypothetical protein [Acinetobacter baumannii]